MAAPGMAFIIGIPNMPSVIDVNVRSGPNTTYPLVVKVRVGTGNLMVLDVTPDDQRANLNGRLYYWYKLMLPTGQNGWVRSDLIEAMGDLRPWNLGFLMSRVLAFDLIPGAPAPVPMPVQPLAPAPISVPDAVAAPVFAPAPIPALIVTTPPVTPVTPVSPVAPVAAVPVVAPVVPPAPAPVIAAPVVAPVPVVPVPAPLPAVPAAPASTPTGYVLMRDGANMRSAPSVSASAVTRLDRDVQVRLLEVAADQQGGPLRWVRVSAPNGAEGWMREDVLRFDASAEALDLIKADLYGSPMVKRWWVRGYEGPTGHWGWDLGANTGEPVVCGPQGALVVRSVACTKCLPGTPSFKNYGIELNDSAALGDSAWNFGYGHYVIVRYLNADLPASTQQALASLGFAGMHIFAMHAHLDSRTVNDGQTLAADETLGTCGTTGNSEGTHLHLELRASANANDTNWAGMKPRLLDPIILYQR